MFTEFEAAVRDGLLEKLESGEQKEEKLEEIFEDQKPEEKETLTVSDIGEVEELAEIEEITEHEDAEEEKPTAEPETVATEEPTIESEVVVVEESTVEPEVVVVEESVAESKTVVSEEPVAEKEEETLLVNPEPVKEKEAAPQKRKSRNLTREEKELFGSYIQGRSMKDQLVEAIDTISMAAYTGNVIVTGVEGMDTMGLAKNIIREVQMMDSNLTGKIGKISGDSLNSRVVKDVLEDLKNGALIIQKASKMKNETAMDLYKVLQQEEFGIVVVMEDTKRMIDRFLQKNTELAGCFTARVDVTALSNDALVAFAQKYAREREYSIDEFGLLALHTRIEEMQTSDHAVTVKDVKEIMDEAIDNAERKTIGHFFDVVFGKRYDDEDMIILKEKDFM
jgi:hypothetical protein